MHKALFVAVEQVSALAADGLADEKTLSLRLRRKGGGMKLDVAQVLDARTHVVGDADAVPGGNGGISCILVHAADPSAREENVARIDLDRPILSIEDIKRKTALDPFNVADHTARLIVNVFTLLDLGQ